MSALPPPHDPDRFPDPLEFLKTDSIHADNLEVIQYEERRWRLLGRFERLKLKRYVASLARDLQKAHYNPKLLKLHKLKGEFKRSSQVYRSKDTSTPETRRAAKERMTAIRDEAQHLIADLNDLKPTYENYQHYAGWLEYEAEHRADLKAEAKREQQIKREMDREAKWLEALIRDVFRKTKGCHYITTDGKGKQRTRIPKFERSTVRPDAHYFYLAASRKILWWYQWLLPYGVTIDRLVEDEVVNNLQAATKREVKPVWTETRQLMFRVSRLDSPDALPREVKWRDAMEFFPKTQAADLPYTIGVSEARRFQWFNLEDDPHILVAGKSQSGKSNLVNGIIGTLASTHTPRELRMVLIDQKGGIEFTHWYELPHLLWDIVKTVEDVEPVFVRLVKVMRSRMAILEKAKAKKFSEYNAKVDADYQLERVLIIIDEMNTFVGMGKKTERLHDLLALLTSQGRAVGMHVIAATQHPEVRVIPTRVKANMAMRLSGAMVSVVASMAILDNVNATLLDNLPGRFAASCGLKDITVQVPHILDEDIAGVVSSTRKAYPDVPENLSEMKDAPTIIVWNEQRVLEGAIELLEGQLSGDKLHEVFGGDSPGIRELRRLCQHIRDTVSATGCVERESNHTEWKIKRVAKAFYLIPLVPNAVATNESALVVLERPTVVETVASEEEPSMVGASAAD